MIVLLSGGLDSVANLALAKADGTPVLALTADYGQKAAKQEIFAAKKFSEWAGVPHQVVDLTWLGRLGGSGLTVSAAEIPALSETDLNVSRVTVSTAAAVWVPNRNGVLINVAAAYADRMNVRDVVVGFNREEAETFPDNSEAFMDRATQALELSTRAGVRVVSYTAKLDKTEIVRLLQRRFPHFPVDWIWSCYRGEEKACGTCESCRRLARATAGSVAGAGA